MCLKVISVLVLYLTILFASGQEDSVSTEAVPVTNNLTTVEDGVFSSSTPNVQLNVSRQTTTSFSSDVYTETQQNVTAASTKLPGIDFSSDGKAPDLFSYLFGDILGETPLSDCSKTVSLTDVTSSIPPEVYQYFNNDVTLKGIISALFLPELVKQLQDFCKRGDWCLTKTVHQSVLETSNNFYRVGPFCSKAMLQSLENLKLQTNACDQKSLNFINDAVKLLCGIERSSLTLECYARTLETLYVTFSDLTHPSGSTMDDLVKEDCNDLRTQMINTYMCAENVCAEDIQLILRNFTAWKGVPARTASIIETCNMTIQCELETSMPTAVVTTVNVTQATTLFSDGFEDEDIDNLEDYETFLKNIEEILEEEGQGVPTLSTPREYFVDELNDIYNTDKVDNIVDNSDDTYNNNKVDNKIDNSEDNDKQNFGSSENSDAFDDQNFNADNTQDSESVEDRTVMLGLISMTVVLVLGLVGVAIVGFKRYRRLRYSSLRRGYSQLSEEESKILQHEYN
ncbi:uncharacterized protein LOC106053743 [Biomphalaria glabrata]|uniref:Uncharacterized protein LOC106053743 n=2 Tax=Biomphalaria glabrata TaxID=6526 RepID=A0A9W3ANS4_BIOGL|nr:uncharacterized protein LOC106053743 [Biomphalaria glabrata]